jgi:hypothetical protein
MNHPAPLQEFRLSVSALSAREFYLREDDPNRWVLDAPYQRGHVWSEARQQALLMSLFQGVPVGTIFVNRRSWDMEPYYVVDGKQRISAIRAFQEGRLAVPAHWFNEGDVEAHDDGMVRYSDLSRPLRLDFDGSVLGVAESRLPSVEAEADLYLRVNFGGEPQTEADRDRAAKIAAGEEKGT